MRDDQDRGGGARERWRTLAAVVAVIVAVAYLPSLGNGFAFDDRFAVQDAAHLLSQPSLFGRLFSVEYFALSGEATWRPVVTASYMLDWQVGGGAPLAFHLQSLLWHLLACVLVVKLFAGMQCGVRVAAGAALLFGLHPLATEAVDAIAFREDVQCTALGLAAVVLTTRGRGAGTVVSAGVLFLLALLAKESAVVFLVLAPLAWWGTDAARGTTVSLRDAVAARRAAAVGFVVAAVVFAVLRFGVFGAIDDYAQPAGGSRLTGVASGAAALLRYAGLVFVPDPLCADYRGVVDPVTCASDLRGWGGAVVLLALVAAAWCGRKRAPCLSVGLAWFVIALVPTAGLVAIPVFMAERFTYMALPGAALALVTAAVAALRWAGIRNQRALVIVLVLAALMLGTLTWRRHRAWRDDRSLWGAMLRDFPASYGALHGFGTAVQAEGRFEESLPYLLKALRLAERTPGVSDYERAGLLAAIGTAHGAAGRAAESVDALTRSLALEDDGQARHHLALGYLQLGRIGDAEREMRAAIALEPRYAPPYLSLSDLLRARGDTAEADRLRIRYEELTP